jgi:periplasmic copper chaperone A
MRRLLLQFAAASMLTAGSIMTAYAHCSLEKNEAAPGSYKAVLKTPQQSAGAEDAWNEEPSQGQDPHSPKHPASSLTILAAGTGDGHGAHGMAVASGDVTAGHLTITGAWARPMLPGQPAGGGYLTIANRGQAADKLVSVSSPNAGRVEIHTMEVVNDVMVMRPVEGGLDIPAGATLELKPGGQHVMFMGVKEPFKEGGSVPVTFEFEKAGNVEVMLPVQAKQGADEHSQH